MGEMADYYNELLEDDVGREEDPDDADRGGGVTCRCCGVCCLFWRKHNGKWRLYEEADLLKDNRFERLHRCTVNPLKET